MLADVADLSCKHSANGDGERLCALQEKLDDGSGKRLNGRWGLSEVCYEESFRHRCLDKKKTLES